MKKIDKTSMHKKIMLWLIAIILIMLLAILLKTVYKTQKSGNNMSNKTTEEIAKNILNISQYNVTADVTVESNKNTNKYILKQEYSKEKNISKQIVEAPENIGGLTTSFDGHELKIENSKINLTKIYENYTELTQNHLFLETFIKDYNESENKKISENENTIEMSLKMKNENNKYSVYKKLYIDKQTGKPLKLEVQDINQKIKIYILYNEININSSK